MILDVFQCSQLFYDVFSWVGTFMDNHPMCAQNAPQNVRIGDGYALHSDSIKVTTQLKASENT